MCASPAAPKPSPVDAPLATAYFAARLAFETDPSDVNEALKSGDPGFVLVDTRSVEAWREGHARGAMHLPKPDMPAVIPTYPAGTSFVVYCWGPGCNGATRAALIIAQLGYAVKEMVGGFEYWAREGLEVDAVVGGESGGDVTAVAVTIDATRPADPVAAVAAGGAGGGAMACGC